MALGCGCGKEQVRMAAMAVPDVIQSAMAQAASRLAKPAVLQLHRAER